MRNINNAVYDMLEDLGLTNYIDDRIEEDPENQRRTIIKLSSKNQPNRLLEIEIIEIDDDEPIVCVLNRVDFSRRVMTAVMDSLMDYLESEPTLEPQS